MQAKTCLYSISGTANTACAMTQGVIASTVYVHTQEEIASTAYGRPQAEFSQIFPVEHLQKTVCIRVIIPLTPFAKISSFCMKISISMYAFSAIWKLTDKAKTK